LEFASDSAFGRMLAFVTLGGPAMWAITALSVATTALILWKIVQMVRIGAM
jgi:biopolymer transport protein ExbB